MLSSGRWLEMRRFGSNERVLFPSTPFHVRRDESVTSPILLFRRLNRRY